MAAIKFTGVTYDYGNINISIASDAIGISKIGTSGITLGGSADYDRIAGLAPTVCKIKDAASSVYNTATPAVGASAITMTASSKTYTLKKIGNKLNCKVTS